MRTRGQAHRNLVSDEARIGQNNGPRSPMVKGEEEKARKPPINAMRTSIVRRDRSRPEEPARQRAFDRTPDTRSHATELTEIFAHVADGAHASCSWIAAALAYDQRSTSPKKHHADYSATPARPGAQPRENLGSIYAPKLAVLEQGVRNLRGHHRRRLRGPEQTHRVPERYNLIKSNPCLAHVVGFPMTLVLYSSFGSLIRPADERR